MLSASLIKGPRKLLFALLSGRESNTAHNISLRVLFLFLIMNTPQPSNLTFCHLFSYNGSCVIFQNIISHLGGVGIIALLFALPYQKQVAAIFIFINHVSEFITRHVNYNVAMLLIQIPSMILHGNIICYFICGLA